MVSLSKRDQFIQQGRTRPSTMTEPGKRGLPGNIIKGLSALGVQAGPSGAAALGPEYEQDSASLRPKAHTEIQAYFKCLFPLAFCLDSVSCSQDQTTSSRRSKELNFTGEGRGCTESPRNLDWYAVYPT